MDKDIEDIKKLDAVIKNEHDHNNFKDEFDDFINNTISDDEEQLEGLDEQELTEIEDAVDNIFDFTGQNRYHNVDNLNFSGDINLVKNFLDLEEIKVINSCKDVKLKKLLVLNRAKHVQLQSIRYRLYELLKECKMSIKSTEQEMESTTAQKKHLRKGIMPRLGHPYFKTKDFYSCGLNDDILRKQKNGEISIDYMPQLSRWTADDQVILKRAIIFNYTLDMIDKYEAKLKQLESQKKKASDKDKVVLIEQEILEIQKTLKKWKDNDNHDPPALNSNVEINWINISKADLNDRHSPHACKAFWNIYLHPSINKGEWSKKENDAILEIAKKYNYENWEQIATEVKTNRSGFAVCVHYYTTLSDKIKRDRFDPEEDQFLIDIVNACRIGNYIPWSKVTHYFDNRSRSQLYHRYRYNLEYSNMKKGTFSQAEDVLIAVLVNKFGRDFARCCKYIPNRSPTQIGHRYKNYLVYDRLHLGFWSLTDDQAILEHVKIHGAKSWSKLFTVLKMKNRTHLRQRYMYIKKWLTQNPNKDLTDIPRRTKRRKGMTMKNLEMVKKCAEHFTSSLEIPSIYEINEQLKAMGEKPGVIRPIEIRVKNDNIDKELMQFFQSRCKIRTSKVVSPQDVNHIVEIVKILMTILDVELVVPNSATIRNHPHLDALDTEILLVLFKDMYNNCNTCVKDIAVGEPIASSSSSSEVYHNPSLQISQPNKIIFSKDNAISYVPPNINTLVGMRSMLLMYQVHKHKRSVKNQICKLINSETIHLKSKVTAVNQSEQNVNTSDPETFMNRVKTIFKWPALMSVMEPNENLVFKNCVNKQSPKHKTGKIGRPKKNLIKIELMNKARLSNYLSKNAIASTLTSISGTNSKSGVTILKKPSIENEATARSSSDPRSGSELLHIKEEVLSDQMNIKNECKRSINSAGDKQQVKRIKTDTSTNFEIMQLKEDINKLDSILLSEFNNTNHI